MSVNLTTAALTISIDLQLEAEPRDAKLVEPLLSMFAEYQVPATWAIADPAESDVADRISTARERHEVAILGDRTWIGREAGRGRFRAELTGKINAARGKGFSATTLVVRDAKLDSHFDLAVKHGVAVVTSVPSDKQSRSARSVPVALRFGLWDIPASCSLPTQSGWLFWSARRGVRRSIDRAIAQHMVCHLAIAGQSLADRGRPALRALERVLMHVRRRCDQSLASTHTMASVAQLLTRGQQSVPARSILRPAA